ncbi:MAG TPA: cell division protein SepF [Acidimicrobiales bacterium]|nr:cell division protein SepF [Acidimicrobiales bacterium]
MSVFRRAMVYLGLVDDDYDDYGSYEDPQIGPAAGAMHGTQPVPQTNAPMGAPTGAVGRGFTRGPAEQPQYEQNPASAIRTLPRDGGRDEGGGLVSVTPKPSVVRPISPDRAAKVHVVEPADFGDAKEIGDRFKAGQPVIVTLQGRPDELRRRLVDFCSGVVYVLDGSMNQVTKGVYLLTPSNVEVSAEEKRRLQEQGLYRG